MKTVNRRKTSWTLAAIAAFAMVAAGPAVAGCGGSGEKPVRYEVTFVPSWNPATHPDGYPLSHAKQGLLTPIIGATHKAGFQLFEPGRTPSPGLEALSEMGKHDPLASEIRAAIDSGEVDSIIQLEMGSAGPVHPTVSLEVNVTRMFSKVSLVGMIAPSPDWFYGVSGVDLYEGGRWIPQTTVEVYAWDSGGDAGTTYLAEDADLDPKESTRFVNATPFLRNGEKVPVGVFVFKLVPGTEG